MKKNSFIILAIIVLVVVGGGAFYGGMSYGKTQNPYAIRFSQGLRGTRTGPGSGQTNLVTGAIISKDSQSITVKMPNNSSKIVFYSNSTQIDKTVSGTNADLTEGTNVYVTSTTNSDGSETAKSIQIRPARPQQ